uniref:RING-type domain-containing protein n=1 Tax=Panagrolaimus sp. PS1159 TaxID=55785 RepID=A0AC35GJP5_9BILA
MSSISDYESASSSDFDEDYEIIDGLKKQNFQLKNENHELKSLLSNALNRLQIAKISKEYAFLPCFHLIACEECSEKCSECPICRKRINDTLKIYMN